MFAALAPGQVQPDDGITHIWVRPDKILHPISPLLFGVGIEWTENGNGLVDENGRITRELIEAIKPLRIPVVRFPGGILADFYHWRQGVGTVSQRPLVAEPQNGVVHQRLRYG